MTDNTQLVADLNHVRGVISRGWCQNNYHDGMGGSCLTAGFWGLPRDNDRAARVAILDAIIALELDSPSDGRSDLVRFNDATGRTQAEVLSVIDKAIATAEAGI